MINVTALQLEIGLGRFHRVTSLIATDKYIEIQNDLDVLFLIPVYPHHSHLVITAPPPDLATPPALSVVHLDHLEFHDVTKILITPTALTLSTAQGVSFNWKVHRHAPLHA